MKNLESRENKANHTKHKRDALVSLECEKPGIEHSGIVLSSPSLGNLILFDVIQLMREVLF